MDKTDCPQEIVSTAFTSSSKHPPVQQERTYAITKQANSRPIFSAAQGLVSSFWAALKGLEEVDNLHVFHGKFPFSPDSSASFVGHTDERFEDRWHEISATFIKS